MAVVCVWVWVCGCVCCFLAELQLKDERIKQSGKIKYILGCLEDIVCGATIFCQFSGKQRAECPSNHVVGCMVGWIARQLYAKQGTQTRVTVRYSLYRHSLDKV